MKTPAIIASLTVVGSLAYATGSQGTAGKQSPVMPSGTQAHSMQEEAPQGRMLQGSDTDCPTGEPLHWFLQTPHIVECSSPNGAAITTIPYFYGGNLDVNGDGQLDFYGSLGKSTVAIIADGTPTGSSASIWVSRIDLATGRTLAIRDTLEIVPPSLGDWILQLFPSATYAQVETISIFNGTYVAGWRDMDGDGDFDYVARVEVQFDSSSASSIQIWFENTGYEKPAPPLAADINRDGRVDGADLGLVLVSWGTNP
jgi:hypothetical protein